MAAATAPTASAARTGLARPADQATTTCQLGNDVKHVIEITFDNVHFFRDNPDVPSDLQLMPSLLQFIENNATMLSNNHTPLIAHTADGILTTFTGLYGDRQGMPISKPVTPITSRTPRPRTTWASACTARRPTRSAPPLSGQVTVPASGTTGTWIDETDIRPTIMYLAGLRDDYEHDGRVITQILTNPNSALGA